MAFAEPGLIDMIMRLRSRGISDIHVLRAMEQIPRSVFVPDTLKMSSYDECEIPIACGQNLLSPLTIAILLQTLEVSADHKVLQIGTGNGYSVAVLAKLSKRVYGIERYKTLCEDAEHNAQALVNNTVLRHGDGRFGWRGQAPFDRIFISASVRMFPSALLDQLVDGGRLIAVVDGQLSVAQSTNGKIQEKTIMPMQISALEPGKSKAL